jgi:phage tail sheath protein FI
MPEYLAPGVYVEEVSFRSKSLEGVATSTTGFSGMTHFGPVQYPGGPSRCEPRLITSFTEFERVYGGLEPLEHNGVEYICYLTHAARAFFINGGRRLYVSRVFAQPTQGIDSSGNPNYECCASRSISVAAGQTATWRARWPGKMGEVHVVTEVVRSKLTPYTDDDGDVQLKGVRAGAVIEIFTASETPLTGNQLVTETRLAVIRVDLNNKQSFLGSGGDIALANNAQVNTIEMRVRVTVDADRIDVYDQLAPHPDQKRYIGEILQLNDPEDEDCVVWLDWSPSSDDFDAGRLVIALQGNIQPRLEGGTDGDLVIVDDIRGEEADPDDAKKKATGLAALGEIDDIAIVAAPDGGGLGDADTAFQVGDALITHCETLRYRIGIVDAPKQSSINEIRAFRGRFDTKYAAMYHPWIEIFDPTSRPSQGAPQKRLLLPPSGFVAGIFARSDIERGVHKAPANEVVRGLNRFEININTRRQDVLNPEGVNCLRFFEGRGNRVWGARTMSSDPEWKYVNVRRLFIYLEHSLDKGTQWAVFEPNNQRLWSNIRRMVEDFLYVLWRDGALLGDTPEKAYFVRCDRTTMTQNDLDNGRMICLVGVSPVKPAEFVIFRVGQWTADANT